MRVDSAHFWHSVPGCRIRALGRSTRMVERLEFSRSLPVHLGTRRLFDEIKKKPVAAFLASDWKSRKPIFLMPGNKVQGKQVPFVADWNQNHAGFNGFAVFLFPNDFYFGANAFFHCFFVGINQCFLAFRFHKSLGEWLCCCRPFFGRIKTQ